MERKEVVAISGGITFHKEGAAYVIRYKDNSDKPVRKRFFYKKEAIEEFNKLRGFNPMWTYEN